MMKSSINTKFFQKWSSEMAYILGYIAADGSISRRKDRDSYAINITSKEKDHLERIKKFLCPTYKISSKSSGYTKSKDYSCLQISNREMGEDLISLGIIPRKTYSFSLPHVPDKYFPDFVRGFFDGDGTVYIYFVNNTPQIKAGFVGCSIIFIKELNSRLCERLKILPKNIHRTDSKDKKKLSQYSICFYIDDCDKLASFMYKNKPSLFLPRKRKIFEEWRMVKRRGYVKNDYPSKIGWQLNQKSINI